MNMNYGDCYVQYRPNLASTDWWLYSNIKLIASNGHDSHRFHENLLHSRVTKMRVTHQLWHSFIILSCEMESDEYWNLKKRNLKSFIIVLKVLFSSQTESNKSKMIKI